MITNNITNALLGSIEHINPQVAPENAEAYLATIEKAQRDLEKIEPAIALLDNQPADSEILAMVAAHQKQVVQSMVSSNPEDAIALTLAASIEAYGKQLEDIQAWTEGGAAVIGPALDIMFDSIMSNQPLTDCLLQDLFQVALIDMMTNPDEYPGMDSLLSDPAFLEACGDIFEFTGSGAHKHPGKYGGDTTQVGDSYRVIWQKISDNVTIPPNSLAANVFSIIDDNGGIDRLVDSMELDEYYTDPDGFVNWPQNQNGNYPTLTDTATHLSPFLTLTVLANLAINSELDPESWEAVLSGDMSKIDNVISETTSGAYDDVFEYLVATDDSFNDNPDLGWDIQGNGVPSDYFFNLFLNFPDRQLTDEELEEVNRIGDQVKMLQQTLKYWLQICRDEQMAIARNI
ncbi:hypothetical protein MHN79_15390 [Vibrio sp. Of14-4]|uniref:hypothetical protein n=1 Tax=Vibrio sp. Of14-4 TaxID=2724878 RepID=UPI001EF1B8D9|nr:hypothetical protein [Vibrio sp. Of14-4]MCG7490874.1 hypothetical protein [Vibrio sp. Of14-4]